MIEEAGQIVDVQGAYAWIESERSTSCGDCSARAGCGTGAIARVLGQRRVHLRVLNRIDARVGDHVVVGIPESGLVRGSLAVYAVPLLGLLAGALAGEFAGNQFFPDGSDITAVFGAFAGLAAGIGWLRHFSRATETDASFQPVILRRQIMSDGV
jgi:sigma-E factor negative regulatory protein RseC